MSIKYLCLIAILLVSCVSIYAQNQVLDSCYLASIQHTTLQKFKSSEKYKKYSKDSVYVFIVVWADYCGKPLKLNSILSQSFFNYIEFRKGNKVSKKKVQLQGKSNILYSAVVYDKSRKTALAELAENQGFYFPSTYSKNLLDAALSTNASYGIYLINVFNSDQPYFLFDKNNNTTVFLNTYEEKNRIGYKILSLSEYKIPN